MNAILERWESVRRERRGDGAVFSPAGEVLRTFAQIEAEAGQWESRLTAIEPGMVVGIQSGPSASWPAQLLAVWRVGGIVLPLDGDVTGERRAAVARQCGVAGILTADGWTRTENPVVRGDADLLKLTSGSSAAPKLVRFTAAQLLADAESICETMGLKEADRNYGLISLAHSYGFSNLLTPLLGRGIGLVVAGDLLPRAVQAGLAQSRATVLPAVPAIFRALAGIDPGPMNLRLCLSAGAPIAPEDALAFHRVWGRKIHSFYGASECGGICYDADEDPHVPARFVGPAMRGVELLSAEGGVGDFLPLVRSAAVGLGYFPESDSDTLGQGEFRPADLLRAEAEGYVIAGRLSDFINVSGRKVNPAEIENVLRQCPGVSEAAVLGLADETHGEIVAAAFAGEAREAEMREFCAKRLPAWQVPRHWVALPALPLTGRGKLDRAALRKVLAQR